MSEKSLYKRVVLKLSGEALAGKDGNAFDFDIINDVAEQLKHVINMGVEVGVIIGGGNIWRGRQGTNMDRTTADYMGMLATTINALALQDALETKNVQTRVQTAIEMRQMAEPYIRRRALRHLDKNRIVIVAGGTGNPYFTTDTAAALRATELQAEVLLKGTKVNGVYDKDPAVHSDAIHFKEISYSDVLSKNLRVMDLTAITLCKENSLPIRVFNINQSGDLKKVVEGDKIGTLIRG